MSDKRIPRRIFMKFLRSIELLDNFDDGGADGHIQNGWSWYAGI